MKTVHTTPAYLPALIVVFLTTAMAFRGFAQSSASSPTLAVQLSRMSAVQPPAGEAPAVVDASANDTLILRATVSGLERNLTAAETIAVNPDPALALDRYFLIKAIRKSDKTEIPIRVMDTTQRIVDRKFVEVCFFEISGSPAERTESIKANLQKLKFISEGASKTPTKEDEVVLNYYSGAVHNISGQFSIVCSYVSQSQGKIEAKSIELNVAP